MCGGKTAHHRFLMSAGVLMLSFGVMGSSASAQSGGSSGVISGSIQDESGGALPGVTATLSSPALQVRQMVAVSDASGYERDRAASKLLAKSSASIATDRVLILGARSCP